MYNEATIADDDQCFDMNENMCRAMPKGKDGQAPDLCNDPRDGESIRAMCKVGYRQSY